MVTSTLGFPQHGPEMESSASNSLGRRGQETPVGKGGRDGKHVTPSTVWLWAERAQCHWGTLGDSVKYTPQTFPT